MIAEVVLKLKRTNVPYKVNRVLTKEDIERLRRSLAMAPDEAGPALGRLPVGGVEARRGDRLAGPVGEHQPGRARQRPVGELFGQHVGQEARDRHAAPPGAGLGRPPGELAFHLDELLEDGDRPAGDVDPGPLEADQLAPPQSGLGRGVDQHPEVRVHLLGQPVHLGGGEEAHLDRLDRRGLDPGAR